jgi:hypothetical protein
MNIYTNPNSSFPSQVVPDEEKSTQEYGLAVARAIEGEWWAGDRGIGAGGRFGNNWQDFNRLRLYSRGEQSVQKYKDELSINGDLSYLNLDWKPVPIVSKFVDILVNGMSAKVYDIKAFAQDPDSVKQRTNYAAGLMRDMYGKDLLNETKEKTGLDFFTVTDPDSLPQSQDEIDLHMQLTYKQAIEIAEEELIENVLQRNKYQLTKRRIINDLVVLGIGASKTSFNLSNGITVEYVDPANLVYSYTEDPNFEDIYYVGEVKQISLEELKKQFSYLTTEDLKQIEKYPGNSNYRNSYYGQQDNYNTVNVLYFEYKTYQDQVWKIKRSENGLEKALEKPDTFDPPKNDNFERASRSIEVLYSGAKILGFDKMLRWEMAKNMTRPSSNIARVNMNYSIVAPKMYKGRIESTVSRITGFADMIQLTHLKLQQVLSRMVPDGVFVDVDGLAEVDLGNGTNYNAQEALNMYFQTGSIVGRSLTQEGDPNRGKVPIQELQTSSGNAKIASLIQTYQYYLQMIRDVTGLNEARDASTPAVGSLVGLQKLAAANSNTATRHLMQAQLYLTLRNCENIALRAADALEFPLTRQALVDSISMFNTATLGELMEKQLMEFGIYLELEPDEEEKQMLEQNIQMALQQQSIGLSDAIDLRQIKNLKLANQKLKLSQEKKRQRDQEASMMNIQAQAEANSQTAEKAALAEMQKQQALTESKVQIEQAKSQFEIQRMQTESEIKKLLMAEEFSYQMQLAQARIQEEGMREKEIEDRKDKRVKIQGTQQSQMINQRKTDGLPKNFESAGMDNLGGFGLEQFDPR